MAKGAYIGIANVARKVKSEYIGVNNVSRKVKRGYIGVDNVARQCFSSEAVWSKYSCNVNGVYTDFPTSSEIGTTKTESDWSLSYGQYTNIGTSYHFDNSRGYSIRTPLTDRLSAETTLATLQTQWVGNYVCTDNWTTVGRVTAVNSVTHYAPSGIHVGFTIEIVAKAKYTIKSYTQGSTSYGTMKVEYGDLPETGTLVDGSYDEGYLVLKINSNYYYYILEA